MYSLYLIGVLVLTGGAIAFIGDRLGTRIGKKRLSIFGLRPRHTSIIVTIITGILITAATFGILAAASENVRTALFGMQKLQARMAELSSEVQDTSTALATARQEKAEADEALGLAREDVEALTKQQADLKAETERLQAEGAALSAQNAALSAQNSSLAGENERLGTMNGELLSGNAELSGKNEQLTTENSQLEQRTQQLRDGLIAMREGDITFRAGEILASGVIRGHRPQEEIRADLEALAQLATRNVSARLGMDMSDQEVWVYQPEFDAAVQEISGSGQDMVVRFVAAGNLVRGEPVRSSLELYKNSIIYREHEFILARPYHIKTHDSQAAEQAVMDFLREVNRAATSKGILPDPLRGTVGIIEGAQLYSIVQAVAQTAGDIILSAYAHESTDAQGPLRLDMKVEQAIINGLGGYGK